MQRGSVITQSHGFLLQHIFSILLDRFEQVPHCQTLICAANNLDCCACCPPRWKVKGASRRLFADGSHLLLCMVGGMVVEMTQLLRSQVTDYSFTQVWEFKGAMKRSTAVVWNKNYLLLSFLGVNPVKSIRFPKASTARAENQAVKTYYRIPTYLSMTTLPHSISKPCMQTN